MIRTLIKILLIVFLLMVVALSFVILHAGIMSLRLMIGKSRPALSPGRSQRLSGTL
ncbi:MAG: hypothetical protein P1V20_16500 [Verrucomicrobiales bacterium]|nr:hypothetical protein [Verrucomicrobiales bacterium]